MQANPPSQILKSVLLLVLDYPCVRFATSIRLFRHCHSFCIAVYIDNTHARCIDLRCHKTTRTTPVASQFHVFGLFHDPQLRCSDGLDFGTGVRAKGIGIWIHFDVSGSNRGDGCSWQCPSSLAGLVTCSPSSFTIRYPFDGPPGESFSCLITDGEAVIASLDMPQHIYLVDQGIQWREGRKCHGRSRGTGAQGVGETRKQGGRPGFCFLVRENEV